MKKPYITIALSLCLCLTCGWLIKLKIQDYKLELKKKYVNDPANKRSIFAQLKIDSTDIVFVGDSETERFPLSEIFSDSVLNRGIGGDITAGVLTRIDAVSKAHPAKIFLQIGINDLWQRHISTDSAIKNVKIILGRIHVKSPKTKIYLQSLLPTKVVKYDTLKNYNQKLYLLAEENKYKFIDIYSPFEKNHVLNEKYDSGDGVHLNGNAYIFWAKLISPFVR